MVKSYRVRLLSAPSHRLTGDARLGCMLESGTVTFSDVTDRNTASNYVNSHAFKSYRTPATRAEIIGGLKKQGFLIAPGKNIVPTETGLSLFGVLKQADPALVDPGVTAQLECLLDDVVVGKQEMVAAIDAVCDVAERIISKLKEGYRSDAFFAWQRRR
jgi:reverse gyrase